MWPVVILAGGLGTRVAHLTGSDRPKALLPLDGRTFIDVKLDELRSEGVTDVLLLVGHAAPALLEHVGDGARHGLTVRWREDGPSLLGTGGSIGAALDVLPELFWVTYGDTLLEVPMRAIEAALAADDDIVMTVLPNADEWETSNVDVVDDRVVGYHKGDPPGTHRHLDYGMLLFRRRAFDPWAPGEPYDLGEVIRPAIAAGRVAAWAVARRFYEVGTEDGYATTQQFLADRRTD